MIFDLEYNISVKGIKYKDISMTVNFCDGDEDFHEIVQYNLYSKFGKIIVDSSLTICSDNYYSTSVFNKDEFFEFLERLNQCGVSNIMDVLKSLKSYKILKSGKIEDYGDWEYWDEEHPFTRHEVTNMLTQLGKDTAKEYSDRYSAIPTMLSHVTIDRNNQSLTFFLKQGMEEISIEESFNSIKEKTGLDMETYQDHYKDKEYLM